MSDLNPNDLLARFQLLLPLIVSNGLNLVGAVVILLVGLWLSGRCHMLVVRALSRAPHFDEMLKSFFGSLMRYLVLTVTVLAVLSQFGIQTTSLIAVLGAAGLAVGLALQGTLSNLAAGVMLLIFRPFRIGHKVQVGGITGTVRELSLFWTELVSDDKVQIIVPNGGVWGQPLRNYSYYPVTTHAGEARFRVPETADLSAIIQTILGAATAHPKVLTDPAPGILVDRTTADNLLEVVLSFTVAGDEVVRTRSDLYRTVHDALAVAKPAPAATDGV
ncbi:MAG TPA: mechanosensitive ion channel domain-containing protein [Aliidongia sp.]|uniref:mechanosensitive ion channel family protein n=1 Tax=Aliidongia sp. TaxID=1914230 RepID=UPI002DDDA849|nr:mechanosensitive ion channel domain-containing protein [Aliidongia sp.]HEV2672916.1 mechanosensitive ion channel domain-containing protein [Aliidongia sp.]